MQGLAIDYDALAGICRRWQVKRLLLFGSRARGDARPDSDVDLLVEYNPASGMTMFQFLDLEAELAALFDGFKVDVVSGYGLSPYFKESILRSTEVLYEQPPGLSQACS